MCGISGYIGPRILSKKIVLRTLNLMKSRGPDAQNFDHSYNEISGNVYLFHSRLSIVDLKERGNQPFHYKNYVIIFNGEIYNFLELRESLIDRGIKLKTKTDTEVLLHYYILYGEKCLEKFEGMWSFVIYDKKNKSFFISRDRFGEKPLYFIKKKNEFYFGSEINFIKSLIDDNLQINDNQVFNFLSCGYKSLHLNNETFYKNLENFPSSSFLKTKTFKNLRFKKYWNLRYKPNFNLTNKKIINNVQDLISKSFSLRIRSDVPIALCLSGGLDSTSIASFAKKKLNNNINTYSIIDPDNRYSEKANIDIITKFLDLKNNKVFLKKEKNLNLLKKLISYKSHPLSTISYYNHSLMLRKMKQDKVKVCLAGTAADEIFSGYYDHYLLHLASKQSKKNLLKNINNFNQFIKPFIRNSLLQNPKKYILKPNDRRHIYDEQNKIINFMKKKKKIIFKEKNFSSDLMRNRMMNELFVEATPVILNEDDTNSMFNSIENRNPFLDKNLIEFLYTVPSKMLIQNGYSKFFLRESLKSIMDKKIVYDRKKIGFNSSIDSTFDLNSKHIKDYIFDKKNKVFDYVDYNSTLKVFNVENKPNYLSKFIFNFINIKIFFDLNENK